MAGHVWKRANSRVVGLNRPARATQREQELEEAHRIAKLGRWRWIRATDTVTWSEELYRTFGLDPNLPAPSFEEHRKIYTPESWARLDAAVKRAIETGTPYELDLEMVLPDGTTKWIVGRGEVESYANGEPAQLRGTVQEITERKRSEQKLALSESRYRSLVRASSEVVWSTPVDGNQSGDAVEWQAFTGQTREEIAGFGWANAIHPDDRERTELAWRNALANGTTCELENRLRRHDGVYRNMHARIVPVRDDAGRIVEWVGMHTDITEQKLAEESLRQAEEALRKSERMYRTVGESIEYGVWACDAEGRNTYVSESFLKLLGLTQEECSEFGWGKALHPDEAEQTMARWKECVRAGGTWDAEHRFRGVDGQWHEILARGAPARDDEGRITGWAGINLDISRLKQAEAALRRSEKLATAGRLAASVAHEINNPLSAVTNALYLALRDESLSETTRDYLKLAEQELARVAHVTTQTLQFHKQSSAPAPADVSEVMDSVFSLFAPRLRASSITVEREYQTGEKLYCLNDELRQVFANLISNSLDATPPGGKLRIRVRKTRAWKDMATDGIRVIVADTGHGIPAGLRERVFEPFVSTKEATGTGLGLWVAEAIIRKHDGHIAMRSRTGPEQHGTVFALFFPFGGVTPSGHSDRT